MIKKKKRLKLKKLIIVLTLLLIAMIILLAIVSDKDINEHKAKLEYINGTEWNHELYPEEMPKFIRYYEGNLDGKNIGKSIYYVVTEALPKYIKQLKDFNEAEIREYYSSNEEIIGIDLGITTEIDFVNLIKRMQKLEKTELEFEEYYFDKNTIKTESNSTKGNLYIKYKGCEKIQITVRAYNNFKSGISSVKYYAY